MKNSGRWLFLAGSSLLIVVIILGFVWVSRSHQSSRSRGSAATSSSTTTTASQPIVTSRAVRSLSIEGATFATVTPDDHHLRFFSQNESQPGSLFQDLDLTNDKVTNLTNDAILEVQNVVWSPDTTQVLLTIENHPELAEVQPLYHSAHLPAKSIITYRLVFATKQTQGYDPAIRSVVWSPDGSRIAYIYQDTTVAIANPDGSDWHILWQASPINDDQGHPTNFLTNLKWPKADTILVSSFPSEEANATVEQINTASGVVTNVMTDVEGALGAANGRVGVGLRQGIAAAELDFWGVSQPSLALATSLDRVTWNPDSQHLYVVINPADETQTVILDLDTKANHQTQLPWARAPFLVQQLVTNHAGTSLFVIGTETIDQIPIPPSD